MSHSPRGLDRIFLTPPKDSILTFDVHPREILINARSQSLGA